MIIKGGYMTRVGGGPFPTECGGEKSEKWCNGGGGSRERELQEPYQQASVNSADSFTQGIALRQLGDEYGATTGRPRRVGWLDLLLLQEALRHDTQKNLVLTKLDVLDTCQTIKICTAYIYRGPTYSYGQETIKCGDILDRAVMDSQILRYCEPLYQEFPGWLCSLQDCHDFASLPLELKNIIFYITEQTQAKVCIISIGPDRDETILVD
jgi:adenylosuccinate synthase